MAGHLTAFLIRIGRINLNLFGLLGKTQVLTIVHKILTGLEEVNAVERPFQKFF